FEIAVEPQRVRRGTTFKVTITGTPKPGYHAYPITKRSADPDHTESYAPKWTYTPTPGFQPLWPIQESDPQFEKIHKSGFLLHEAPFPWSQDILVLPDATPGLRTLACSIFLQVCNDKGCTPGDAKFEANIQVLDEAAAAITPALQERRLLKQPAIEVVPIPGT